MTLYLRPLKSQSTFNGRSNELIVVEIREIQSELSPMPCFPLRTIFVMCFLFLAIICCRPQRAKIAPYESNFRSSIEIVPKNTIAPIGIKTANRDTGPTLSGKPYRTT